MRRSIRLFRRQHGRGRHYARLLDCSRPLAKAHLPRGASHNISPSAPRQDVRAIFNRLSRICKPNRGDLHHSSNWTSLWTSILSLVVSTRIPTLRGPEYVECAPRRCCCTVSETGGSASGRRASSRSMSWPVRIVRRGASVPGRRTMVSVAILLKASHRVFMAQSLHNSPREGV